MKKLLLLFLLMLSFSANAQLSLTSVSSGYNQPMSFEIYENNYLIVSEKSGLVYISDYNGSQYVKRLNPIIDISNEVSSSGEQGLLDFVMQNSTIYLYYTCKGSFLSIPADYSESISRITKYDLDIPNNTASNRQIILGQTLSDGIPIRSNHVGGSLNFLSDGSLLVTTGDSGFGFGIQNGIDLGIIPDLDFASQGSYFSTLVAMQLNSCNGKVLRIDTNGNGLNDNPFYESESPRKCKSRVYNIGLRNPFRASVRNDSLFINNVGSANWESVFISDRSALNFGWSMREGFETSNNGGQNNFETGIPFNESFVTNNETVSDDPNVRMWQWHRPLFSYHQDEYIYQTEDGTTSTELYGNSISGSLPIVHNNYGMQGKYMFTDFFTGYVCLVDMQGNLEILNINEVGTSDIKESNEGNIYFCSLYGSISKLEQDTLSLESNTIDLRVVKTDYYNLLGQKANKGYNGVKIIIETYSNGYVNVVKQIN